MKKVLTIVFCVLALGVSLSAQSFEGTWDIYYDWNLDGSYLEGTITFKNDGTFVDIANGKGRWYQVEGDQIIFIYSGDTGTTYAGTRIGGAMLGMMAWPNNSNGYWYAVKQVEKKATKEQPRDMTGKTK